MSTLIPSSSLPTSAPLRVTAVMDPILEDVRLRNLCITYVMTNTCQTTSAWVASVPATRNVGLTSCALPCVAHASEPILVVAVEW